MSTPFKYKTIITVFLLVLTISNGQTNSAPEEAEQNTPAESTEADNDGQKESSDVVASTPKKVKMNANKAKAAKKSGENDDQEKIRVIMASRIDGKDAENIGELVRELVEIQLSESSTVALVDRDQVTRTLSETQLREVESDGVDAQLKMSGANYAVHTKIIPVKKMSLLTFKVVDLESSQFKTASVKHENEQDPFETANQAVEQILNTLKGFGSIAKASGEQESDWKLESGENLPVVAMRIPESSASPQEAPDPAGDKKLTECLQKQGIQVVGLSMPSQSVEGSENAQLEGKDHEALMAEAKLNDVDVIILGAAVSDDATNLGRYHVAKARIELNAYRVSDGKVVATISDYGKGADLSNFVAEKKAIEHAVLRLEKDFITQLASNWK